MCPGSQEQFCSLLRIGCSLRPCGRLPVIFASFLKDGHLAILGGISARFVISGQDVGEQFALVEHPMEPHALAAPDAPASSRERVYFRPRGPKTSRMRPEIERSISISRSSREAPTLSSFTRFNCAGVSLSKP